MTLRNILFVLKTTFKQDYSVLSTSLLSPGVMSPSVCPYQWLGSECISRVCGPRGPKCPMLMEYEDIAKQVLANTQMLSILAGANISSESLS